MVSVCFAFGQGTQDCSQAYSVLVGRREEVYLSNRALSQNLERTRRSLPDCPVSIPCVISTSSCQFISITWALANFLISHLNLSNSRAHDHAIWRKADLYGKRVNVSVGRVISHDPESCGIFAVYVRRGCCKATPHTGRICVVILWPIRDQQTVGEAIRHGLLFQAIIRHGSGYQNSPCTNANLDFIILK